MTVTQWNDHHDSKGSRMLKLSRLFLCALPLLWTAVANAAPVAYTLIGVTLSDGGTASGSFTYDAAANTYSGITIVTTTTGTRSGATYNSVSTGFAPDSKGVLAVTTSGSSQSLPGLTLTFSPVLPAPGGVSTLSGQEADCADAGCTTPSGTTRTITGGTVSSLGGASPRTWYLNGVTFFTGGSATGSFTFNPGTNLFTNVNITTTPGTRAPAMYNTMSTGLVADTSGVLFNTSAAANQTGLPGFSMFFTNALSAAGGTTTVTGQEADCADPACSMPSGTTRLISAGTVTTVPTLGITKTHVGNFTQGQIGATYTVTISNTGVASTVGQVTMTETPPAGLTVTGMSGAGWTCNTSTCTRSDVLTGGTGYPPITVTVNVAGNATSPVTNQASVSGGGAPGVNATDATAINGGGGGPPGALSVNRNTLNFGFNGLVFTSPQTVLVTITAGAAWTATSDHVNITVNPSSGVGTGTFQITANPGPSGVVTVSSPGATGSPQTIIVNVSAVPITQPFGSFDTPINNATGVSGAIPVTGWALDNIEVTRVDILREPITGEAPGNLIYIGTAVFSADARPDVQASFPTFPYQYRAGWGYQMLTNGLPNSSGSGPSGNGTYKIHAIAFNKGGNQFDLGTKTITVDNAHATKPFGTIDTPTQGGTVSGSDYVNFGWALTPLPGIIPIDGSTMTVIIDGVSVGHPTYNNFRSDIAAAFPGYANSGGAVGFFHINTTTLTDGVHTISWNVFDNLARGEGLGSRYFNVLNIGGPVAAPEDVIPDAAVKEGVQLRDRLNRRSLPIDPDSDGGYSVTMEEVGQIELHLGAAKGNLLVESETHELPVGSTLKGGVFYWQPGPGFVGDYTLQFERPDGTKVPVRVKIVPKTF